MLEPMNNEYDPIISQDRLHKLIKQALSHSQSAYEAVAEDKQKTYLAHLIGSLGTLVDLLDPGETIEHRNFQVQEDGLGKKVSKFLTGK